MADPVWLPVEDAAIRVGRSPSTIYEWVKSGRVEAYRPQRKLWVSVADLIRAEAEVSFGRPRVSQLDKSPEMPEDV